MKKVALYIRVSSDEQKRDGISIEAQLKKLQDYCQFKGWTVFKIYKDEGVSGGTIHKRKQFRQLLEDSESGSFSTILITKFDRAFRNTKEALITFEKLESIGIDFVSVNEQIDTTTPMGKFFFIIISALAELEKNLTKQRVDSVKEYKFSKGLFPGKIPFGYKALYKNFKDRQEMVGVDISPKEAEIVLDCFKMASEGISIGKICSKYNYGYQSIKNILIFIT